MKKFLLSIGVMACGLIANATVYTVYQSNVKQSGWAKDGEEFKISTTINGAKFDMTTATDPRQSAYMPGNGSFGIQLREDKTFSITSEDFDIKGVRFTFLARVPLTNPAAYAGEGTLEAGWTQELKTINADEDGYGDNILTMLNEAGSKTFSYTATKYVRIGKIEVSTDGEFGDAEEEDAIVLNDINELMDYNTGILVKPTFSLTVAYSYRTTIWAYDAKGEFIRIDNAPFDYSEGAGKPLYQVNDVITPDWTATFNTIDGKFPILTANSTFPTTIPAEKGDFQPRTYNAMQILGSGYLGPNLANHVIRVADVTFNSATPYDAIMGDYSIFIGETAEAEMMDSNLKFENYFGIPSVKAGIYNVTCVFANFGEDEDGFYPILYPTAYELVEEFPDDPTAVELINGENEAPVYYTLQGEKVETPAEGIYIRVQNGKATKVLVK